MSHVAACAIGICLQLRFSRRTQAENAARAARKQRLSSPCASRPHEKTASCSFLERSTDDTLQSQPTSTRKGALDVASKDCLGDVFQPRTGNCLVMSQLRLAIPQLRLVMKPLPYPITAISVVLSETMIVKVISYWYHYQKQIKVLPLALRLSRTAKRKGVDAAKRCLCVTL